MSGPNGYLSRYLARQWCPVPVHRPDFGTATCSCGKADCAKPGKHPDGRFWPTGSSDPAHFADRNIGIKLGPDSQNLADVDLDCGEAVAVGPALLPATDSTFGRVGRATHLLYTVPARDALFQKLQDPVLTGDQATIVELRWPEWDVDEERCKNLQTVFPPSLHHTGGTVEWLRDGTPAEVAGADLVAAVRHVGAAVLLARYAKPKERHALVLLLANLLVRAGWADDAPAVPFITAVFTAKNDPEKAAKVRDGEGLGAIQDARKRAKNGKPMTGLPALKEMLDPALDHGTADKVVTNIREWLGLPDAPGSAESVGGASSGATPVWELPVPLPELSGVPPFPVHLFPAAVSEYWRAKAQALHVPVEYVAGPALAILGAAVGRARAAEVKPGYAESPLFWIVNIAPPGATKSASLLAGRAPLDREEARWRKEHAEARRAFEAEQGRHEHALKEWRKDPDSSDPPEKPTRPVLRQAVLDDTTAEAAAKVLRDNPRGAILVKDELIGFARMLNQYKAGGKGNDKTFWLTGWNGRGVGKANRSKDHDDGPLVVIDPFTAVAGMMCPDSLPELREELQRGGPTQDGWCDRFLFQYPDPFDAVEETWATVPEELERGYERIVLDLLGLEMVAVEDPEREATHRPFFVRFDDGAQRAWSTFTREIARRANALPKTDHYRGVLSKLKHYGLRFACLFHCLDAVVEAERSAVTTGCMERAAEVVWYFEAHSRRCLGLGDRATEPARRLLAVLAGWEGDRFSKRELNRRVRGQSAFRRSDALDAPLALLAQHGFVAPDQPFEGRGRPAERYWINPLWDRTPDEGMDNMPKNGPSPGNPGNSCDVGGDGQKGFGHAQKSAATAPSETVPAPAAFLGMPKTLLSGAGRASGNADNSSVRPIFGHIVHVASEETDAPELGVGLPSPVLATQQQVASAVEAVGSAERVGLDLETTGLNPARARIRLVSLATATDTFVIDLFALGDPVRALAPLFAVLAEKEIVGHNIVSFDLPFLARQGFRPTKVFDTALASRVAYAGERVDHDLASVVERELGQTLDKDQQDSDWSRPALTGEQLAYAAADVGVLLPLADALRGRAAERKVEVVVDLEMRCGVPVARMAANGVAFDAEPWLALADRAARRRVELAAEMDALVPNPNCLPGLASWNWDSNSGDVPKALASAGISVADTQEETLAGIDHPLAQLLLEYREAAKRTGTYGREWVEEHVTGGRVFATWNPCQAKTGRMSCKGPNLQQVPRAAAYRQCFVAKPGHVLVKCDFSQIELRIAAKVIGDARMLAAYQKGEDLHTLTAARFLGVEPGAVTKDARQMAKPVNFGSIYGLGPRSLRLKARADYGKEMTENQARKFLDAFFAQYPGVRKWHNGLKCDKATAVWTLGGRRISVEPDQFYGAKANYVIQGTGGDGLKRALVLLWERREQCPSAEVVLAVHDEIVIEVPEAEAEVAKAWVEQGMIDAMAPLIDPVPVGVEAKVGRTWGG